jgi:hypothetical protein
MSSISNYRRVVNRCPAVKVETGGPKAKQHRYRSWRCDLVAGHPGPHESHSGHRRWQEPR